MKARNQELSLGLLCGFQESNYLSHHLLLLRVHISRKLASEADPGPKPGAPEWSILTAAPLASPSDPSLRSAACSLSGSILGNSLDGLGPR